MACYEARIRCLACNMERQCLHWLERSLAEWSVEPPEFCHNAEFFRRCRQGKRSCPIPSSVSMEKNHGSGLSPRNFSQTTR
jgi:hypothetical protein